MKNYPLAACNKHLIEETDGECLVCLLHLQNIIHKSNQKKNIYYSNRNV